ncbi:hypothetical protein [Halorubellus salinus]|uniref:hypothetical protein n=1 Tax=Halorubellus salinus TaxID=755309 RepID=UPI001D06C4BE|nr:hypothetical protein [Halorubellus salinus]
MTNEEATDADRHEERSPEERTNVPAEELADVDDAVEDAEAEREPGERTNTEKLNDEAREQNRHDNAPDEMPNRQQ